MVYFEFAGSESRYLVPQKVVSEGSQTYESKDLVWHAGQFNTSMIATVLAFPFPLSEGMVTYLNISEPIVLARSLYNRPFCQNRRFPTGRLITH